MNFIYGHLLSAAAVAAFFMPGVSLAQPICGDRQFLLQSLANEHKEARVALGLAASGQVVEVLVAPSGSWSIVVSQPNGRACLIGAGQGWQDVSRPDAKRGKAS